MPRYGLILPSLLLSLAACTVGAPQMRDVRPNPAAVADLAPSGKLRAAINFGNPILAKSEGRGINVSWDGLGDR